MDISIVKEKATSFWEAFKIKWKKMTKHEYFKAFIFTFLVGFFLFALEAVPNGFTLFLNGDYSLQSLSFYADGYTKMWRFFKTGEFPMFDYSNLFGENYIGSQSFYYLGSPFFWLLLLVPRPLLYQGIYFFMILKLAVGGLFFYILLRKYFNISEKVSLIGACCYAFSGWTMYYLWFHFGDVLAFFPLIIIGIEKLLRERKGWVLTLGLFLCCVTNYFFGATFVIFGVLYALFRWIQIYGITKRNGYSAKERWSVLLQGILYYIAGVGLAAFILLPASVSVADSGRADTDGLSTFLSFFLKSTPGIDGESTFAGLKSFNDIFSKENLTNLFDYCFKWSAHNTYNPPKETNYYILSNFLFINSNCWGGTLFNNPDLDNTLGGFFVTTPISLLLVPSLIRAAKTKKKWTIFGCIICLIAPFLPITFYLFHGFTFHYGRWQIIIVLVSLIFLLKTLDNFDDVKLHEFIPGAIVNVGLALYLTLYSNFNGYIDETYNIYIFGAYRPVRYQLLILCVQVVYILLVSLAIITILLLRKYKFVIDSKKIKQAALVLVIFELFVQATVTVNAHGYAPYSSFYGGQAILNDQRKVINNITEKDGEFYRIYDEMATRGYVNHPSTLSYNGLSMFNSIYNNESDDFIKRSRLSYNGSWIAAVHEKRNYLDEFLGVKYYLVSRNDPNNDGYYFKDWTDHDTADLYYEGRTNQYQQQQTYSLNIPNGYVYREELSSDDFMVYENTNFIELGFAYDTYISSNVLGPNLDSYLSPNGYPDSSYYEKSYFHSVVIEEEDLAEDFLQKYTKLNTKPTFATQYALTASSFNMYLKPREDVSKKVVEEGRDLYKITSNSSIRNYFSNSEYGAILHGRWTDHQSYGEDEVAYSDPYFGDQIVIEPKTTTVCQDATNENPCNLNIKFQMGPQVVISLYNGDTLITQDAHMTHNYTMSNKYGEYKMERGFYSNQPVTRIVIEFINDSNLDAFEIGDFQVKYEYQNDYLTALQQFKDNAIENVVYKTNSFTFETNYETPKLLVLNVPYDAGWSMKINGKDAKIYNANGGFVMVEAPSGEATYELSYFTPRLDIGLILTGISALFLTCVSCFYNREKIKVWLKKQKEKMNAKKTAPNEDLPSSKEEIIDSKETTTENLEE